MKAYIANTDYGWYSYLQERPGLEEVNFWRPLGATNFRALSIGNPFFFKLKKEYNHAIAGFGFFVLYKPLPIREAWAVFLQGNGAVSYNEMWARVSKYMLRSKGIEPTRYHNIGCILLTSPIFFPEDMWVKCPSDWHDNIVAGKSYDTSVNEGKRIWNECLERAELLRLQETALINLDAVREVDRFGSQLTIRPRLGQGTFRYAVEQTYKKCAVSREHSLPALDAAHIIPYSDGGTHEISNGILLRADIHRLYDRGYVSITPDHEFKVSDKLYEDYHNGKIYYNLNGSNVVVPENEADHPRPEHLEYHFNSIYLG